MFSFLSDWDKLLFVLTHLQYWDSLLAIFKSIVTMCKLPHDPKYPLVSSTLKSSLTQHSEFTVIAALSKASWGHHMKSNPACSSTPLPPNWLTQLLCYRILETCDFYAKPLRSNGLCPNPLGRTWGVWSLSTNAEPVQTKIPLRIHIDLFDMHFPYAPVMQQRQETHFYFCIVNVSTHFVLIKPDPNPILIRCGICWSNAAHSHICSVKSLHPIFICVLDWIWSIYESPEIISKKLL